jgi:quinol-cytochrome oxidoreductase complex cytochrome b subunit
MAVTVQPEQVGVRTTRWAGGTQVLLLLAGLLLVVIVVSGILLSRSYRPSGVEAWDIEQLAVSDGESAVRTAHRAASTLLFPVAVATAVGAVGWSVVARRHAWVGAAALLVGVAAAAISGFMLAWDQIALWAVSVGTDVRGIWWVAFDDEVRFVIVDGSEVSQAAYRNVVGAHLLLTGVLAASVVLTARSISRRRER